MKKFALILTMVALWAIKAVHAAEFFCPSGNVTCLIAAINEANGMSGQHIINLEPGNYTLQTINNGTPSQGNGLPVIGGSIRIQATVEDIPTVIERDINAPGFRIFEISAGGELTLHGVTVQRGLLIGGAAAILNRGVTSLEDSVVRESGTQFNGAIHNLGTLRVIRSIIADNFGGHQGGGILNSGRGDPSGNADGNVLVENSTITGNVSADGGGIFNYGSLVVKNSTIIFNSTDEVQPGGGILNVGSAEIVNSTIAKNSGGFLGGGGGLFNSSSGRVSIINSTIRENISSRLGSVDGGGISNDGGILQLQNTIVAGNTAHGAFGMGPDCFGTITSLGNNLIGDATGCTINLQPNDLTGDPGLGALVEIGEDDSPGKAFYPVLAGSVVINRANPAACPKKDQLGNPRVGICDIGAVEFQGPERMLVFIDVRPRSDANKINPSSNKNINVAILSVNGFDATTIDPNTVRFGATGTEATPIHVARRDVERDGDRDIVLRFAISDTGIECGATSAVLTGQTTEGQAIIGSSPITTVQCGKQKKPQVAAKGK
jgi:hypothetical protein